MSTFLLGVLFWTVACLCLLMTVRGTRNVLAIRFLAPWRSSSTQRRRVSVVVAARDEETSIETTVRRLLAQEGVELELIVVDDRSRDRTGEIVRELAQTDPRLRIVRVEALPEGWLGKCHACHVGAAQATGDWLLFTDGDIWLKSDVVARAVQEAEREQADHITLIPGVRGATFLGCVNQVTFSLGMARRAANVNRDKPRAYLGIGAFNLVRRDAYRAMGGHESLRMEVVDDLKLGLLLKRAGRRSRAYFAPHEATADWCVSVRGVIQAFEKNHFAVLEYRPLRAFLAVAVMLGFWTTAMAGPWTGTISGMAAGLALLSLIVPAIVAAVRLRWPIAAAFLVPFLLPVLAVSVLNSAMVTLRRGGIRWRDTFYSLEALRAGVVR